MIAIVLNCLSTGCKSVLVEIEKSSPRMYEKVILSAADVIVSATNLFSPAIAAVPISARKSQPAPSSVKKGIATGVGVSPRPVSSSISIAKRPPSKSPPSAAMTSEHKHSLDLISGLWFEATLVLKHTPADEADWQHLFQVSESSQAFFEQMSKSAISGGIPRGALLQVVLPFDNATSLADQAATAKDAPLPNLPGIPRETLINLRDQAVALRRLIRVKMADEADLQQAIGTVALLNKLCAAVEKLTAHPINMPLSDILQTLN